MDIDSDWKAATDSAGTLRFCSWQGAAVEGAGKAGKALLAKVRLTFFLAARAARFASPATSAARGAGSVFF